MFEVIDVSKYQGNIDFAAVKASGIYAVIIRAGFGREVSQVDPRFVEYYDAARAAGLFVGSYWYSYAVDENDARREADVFVRVLGDRVFDMPLYLDMERHDMGTGNETKCAVAFLDVLKARRPADIVGFYSYTAFMQGVDMDTIRAHCDTVWKADYRPNPDTAIQCDMHQYTSTGTVPGITGNVDKSHLYRDFPAEKNMEVTGMNTITIGPASSGDLYIIAKYCDSIGVTTYEKTDTHIIVREISDAALEKITECVDGLGNIPYTVDTGEQLAEIEKRLDSIEKHLADIMGGVDHLCKLLDNVKEGWRK